MKQATVRLERTSARGALAAIVASGIILGQGCAPLLSIITGPPLSEEDIKKIDPGKTPKAEILERFGVPMAVGAKGERLTIPRESAWKSSGGIRLGGYYQTESDTFFELFSSRHNIRDHHRVYYYYQAVSSGVASPVYKTVRIRVDKLWVLVNEETGVVEDYVFKKGE